MASLIARRTAELSVSNKAQPTNSEVIVDLAVASVLHRRVWSLSSCFMRLKSSSICQRAWYKRKICWSLHCSCGRVVTTKTHPEKYKVSDCTCCWFLLALRL